MGPYFGRYEAISPDIGRYRAILGRYRAISGDIGAISSSVLCVESGPIQVVPGQLIFKPNMVRPCWIRTVTISLKMTDIGRYCCIAIYIAHICFTHCTLPCPCIAYITACSSFYIYLLFIPNQLKSIKIKKTIKGRCENMILCYVICQRIISWIPFLRT